MRAKTWLCSWIMIITSAFGMISYRVYSVDPFFHFHKPDTNEYYYNLYNQRSQNDGICKNFDYNALITGTSMTENFRTTEMDEIFRCKSIKVPFSGATYKEINDNVQRALNADAELKVIVRGLDMSRFSDGSDALRDDLGSYPVYLYDSNPFNDIKYILNGEIIFDRVYMMSISRNDDDFSPGITSFDDYSRWQELFTFGSNTVIPEGIVVDEGGMATLTEDEKAGIIDNIQRNAADIAEMYPSVDFYYFFPPYSIAWWGELYNSGEIFRQIEAERIVIELLLQHDNIHLFSFNNRFDVITDLNNYKDTIHYASWINSLILEWMHEGKYMLTKDNYEEYLRVEEEFYSQYDYNGINDQEDYEDDYYAAALLNNELTGVDPVGVSTNRTIIYPDGDKQVFDINLDEGYNYLVFTGQKLSGDRYPRVYIFDKDMELLDEYDLAPAKSDNDKHRYTVNLSLYSGEVSVMLYYNEDNDGGEELLEYGIEDAMVF